MLPVRVVFSKKGIAAYISHLDLQRSVCRALLRSGVNPGYSEGFNPHVKLAFAIPLSVYQESDYEVFDFVSNSELSYGEIKDRLYREFPEGLTVLDAFEPKKKLADLTLADYTADFTTDLTAKEMEQLLSGKIEVVKRSKKGDILTDISGMIKAMSFTDIEKGVRMNIRCSCGSVEHLNVKYIEDFLGDRITDSHILRLNLLCADESLLA